MPSAEGLIHSRAKGSRAAVSFGDVADAVVPAREASPHREIAMASPRSALTEHIDYGDADQRYPVGIGQRGSMRRLNCAESSTATSLRCAAVTQGRSQFVAAHPMLSRL